MNEINKLTIDVAKPVNFIRLRFEPELSSYIVVVIKNIPITGISNIDISNIIKNVDKNKKFPLNKYGS